MGRTQKSPNTSQVKLLPKREEVSDTESESSSGDEAKLPILNITNKIKTEPQYSPEDSESDSEDDKKKIFTQKSPSRNIRNNSSFSEDESNDSKNDIKKEVSESSEDSDTNKNVFQTNKYVISKLPNSRSPALNKQAKQIAQDSDDSSSSSSEQDTLRGAFLGQIKTKSKKSPKTKLKTKADSSSSEDSSVEAKQKGTVKTSVNQKHLVKVKDKSKLLGPKTQKKLLDQSPKQNNVIKKSTPEKVKQKKSRKSDPSITENDISQIAAIQDSNDATANKQSPYQSTDAINIEESNSTSHITKRRKVQVLQHIKFTPMKPKELLQELYPNSTPVNIRDNFTIFNNEEVFLLRIPKTINPQHLLNKELDIILGSKLKIDSEKYVLEPTNKAPDPVLLVGNQSKAIQPRNTYFLKKYIKSPKIPDLELIEKAMVPLPENLKPRHPLFGSNYEDKIQLNENVELRLQKAINYCLKQKEKIKKKKSKITTVDDTQNEVIFSLLGNHTTLKTNDTEEQYDSAFGSSESHNNSAKKKKTKRKSLDESSISVDTNKQMSITEDNEISPKKTKKQKSKKSTDTEWMITDVKPGIPEKTSQKTFKEELSIIAPLDVPAHASYKKKDKKRRSSVFGENTMFENTKIDVKPEPFDETNSKKQSVIDETLSRLKTELLTEYESEWDEKSMKRKKKKKRKSHQEEEKIENAIIDNIKQEITAEFNSFESKKRKRTMSMVEVTPKKSKKSKKNSSFNENRVSFENELDNLLEKVKRDKKMKS